MMQVVVLFTRTISKITALLFVKILLGPHSAFKNHIYTIIILVLASDYNDWRIYNKFKDKLKVLLECFKDSGNEVLLFIGVWPSELDY